MALGNGPAGVRYVARLIPCSQSTTCAHTRLSMEPLTDPLYVQDQETVSDSSPISLKQEAFAANPVFSQKINADHPICRPLDGESSLASTLDPRQGLGAGWTGPESNEVSWDVIPHVLIIASSSLSATTTSCRHHNCRHPTYASGTATHANPSGVNWISYRGAAFDCGPAQSHGRLSSAIALSCRAVCIPSHSGVHIISELPALTSSIFTSAS
ncbi:hypothetical protein B0H14DRAFT_2625351 [Mycena olivaceomarginata]|nr:hypothetical protein B0H14DRAFT_2625351 [Mycena olivaceomarginata]